MKEIYLILTLKIVIFSFIFYLLLKIKSIDAYIEKFSRVYQVLLLISGSYISLSLMQLLPKSSYLFEDYYKKIQNETTSKQINIFPLEYLVYCLGFALILLVERVVGYDYEEQQENLAEDLIIMQEMQEIRSDIEDNRDVQTELSIQAKLKESLICQNNSIQFINLQQLNQDSSSNESQKHFNMFNFLCINFGIFLLGFSYGYTNYLDQYIFQQVLALFYFPLIASILSITLKLTKQLDQHAKEQIYKGFLAIILLGFALGFILSFYENLLFRSLIIAFNSGTLLYVSTMKIIQKYYGKHENKMDYFLYFSIGYLATSYLLFI